MTAFCVYVGSKDVRLLTDGLAIGRYPGAAVPPVTKVRRLRDFGAMTLRGAESMLEWFAERASSATTFEEAVLLVQRAVIERQKTDLSLAYQLVFCGWSALNGPQAYFVAGQAAGEKLPAGAMNPIAPLLTAPSLSQSEIFAFLHQSNDRERDFPGLMDKLVETDLTGTFGAFCEQTVISETGVRSEIVRRYGATRPLDRSYLVALGDDTALPTVFQRALARSA
ncbi:hypothetical protein QV13_17060 [Mesorhizobium hungaricum]|uniref:Uncharacterized protein n=2 Tax=Hyphomicrobiales TaxID=356 RepID=A0A1C2DP13_9HYPH|nr:hypothetical protein QV13_17060 [Mesorhizobium hungaricum]